MIRIVSVPANRRALGRGSSQPSIPARAAHLLHSTCSVDERQETPITDNVRNSRRMSLSRLEKSKPRESTRHTKHRQAGIYTAHAARQTLPTEPQTAKNRGPGCKPNRFQSNDAGWSSQVAREAHNLEVAGSNPVPAISHNFCRSLRLAFSTSVRQDGRECTAATSRPLHRPIVHSYILIETVRAPVSPLLPAIGLKNTDAIQQDG
jgi:hypothetical protein